MDIEPTEYEKRITNTKCDYCGKVASCVLLYRTVNDGIGGKPLYAGCSACFPENYGRIQSKIKIPPMDKCMKLLNFLF